MLESSLHKLPPNEAALALLSFLRDELPAGGVAAEQRFVALYPALCDRIAGRLVLQQQQPDASTSQLAAAKGGNTATVIKAYEYQHEVDAWLSLNSPQNLQNDPLIRLLRAPRCLSLDATSSSPASSSNNNKNINNNGTAPTLLDAVSAESQRVLIDYPLNSFEQNFINCWKELEQSKSRPLTTSALKAGRYVPNKSDSLQDVQKGKYTDTTTKLLQMLPDQPSLRPQQQQQQTVKSPTRSTSQQQHTPFVKSFGGSPLSKTTPTSPASSSLEVKSEVKVKLTMLQYYFILFLRFPLLENKNSIAPTYGRSSIHNRQVGSIYRHLLNSYLSYYLATNTNEKMHNDSELFLRLLMEFWLSHNLIAPTDRSLKYIRIASPTLRDCLDLSRIEKFRILPSKIQNGILATVRHLLSDLSLLTSVGKASKLMQDRQLEERKGSSHPDMTLEKENSGIWCLPPGMTLIQQSLLNYIRVGLACGSIHHKDSSFYRALEIWLLWIEPWNFITKKRMQNTTPSSSGHTPRDLLRVAANAAHIGKNVEYYSHYVKPKSTNKSTYTAQWEGYVAANLHFYVLPLAIFLRRAREFEFSSATEFPRSLTLVQRVLRCYPQCIVNILNSALNLRADALTQAIISKHLELLGPYAPPNNWKLNSCQADAMNLLEEIFGQYEKKMINMNFLERWEAKIEAMFSVSMQSEEGALQAVLAQLKCLVGLPLEYSVPTDIGPRRSRGLLATLFNKASMVNRVDMVGPDRASDGLLTDLGRQQIALGSRKCSPFDVHYLGDPMLAPYHTHELPALVDLAITVSNYLNDKLGFVPLASMVDGKDEKDMLTKNIREMERYNRIVFRLNLRFLADYRNVLAIYFLIWFVRKIIN